MYDLCVHRIYSSVYTRTRNRVCSVHVCITSIYIYIYLNVLSGSCVDNNNNSDDRIEPTDTFQVTHDKFAHGIALSTVSVFMISMHSHSQTYTIITNNNNKRNVCWIYFFFLPVFFLLTVHHRPTETRLHGVVSVCGATPVSALCVVTYMTNYSSDSWRFWNSQPFVPITNRRWSLSPHIDDQQHNAHRTKDKNFDSCVLHMKRLTPPSASDKQTM